MVEIEVTSTLMNKIKKFHGQFLLTQFWTATGKVLQFLLNFRLCRLFRLYRTIRFRRCFMSGGKDCSITKIMRAIPYPITKMSKIGKIPSSFTCRWSGSYGFEVIINLSNIRPRFCIPLAVHRRILETK